MNLITLSVKNLQRRRVRSLLTILGIAISAAALFSLLSFNSGYDQALQQEMQNSGAHFFVSTEGCPMEAASLALHGGEIPKFLDEARLTQIRAVDGVRVAAGMLIFSIIQEDGKMSFFYGIDDEVQKLKPHWKINGSWFKDEHSIILGAETAKVEKRSVGDKIYFLEIDAEFEVAGIIDRTGSEDDGFFFLPLKTAQKVFQKENKLTGVAVNLANLDQMPKVKARIERLPDVYVVTREQMMEQILKLVGSSRSLMLSVLVIAILISLLGVLNTVLMSVFEMFKEFGYLRCVGASGFEVFKLVLLETLTLSFAGAVIGTGAGLAFSSVIDTFIRDLLPYAPAGKYIQFEPVIFGLSVFAITLVGGLAGVYPSLKASRISPMEAVRNE